MPKEAKNSDIAGLKEKARWVRNKILDMAIRATAAHIAPAFSCVEILISLYYAGILRVKADSPDWEDRDRFILSKGQGALALYAILADLGFFSVAELDSFAQAESRLGGHVEDRVCGVEALTGSLGHGLPIASGLAFAAKMDRKDYLTAVLLGDGECHEGSVWEAAMFVGHHRLNNLMAIVDYNGLSATDKLENYLHIEPLVDKWRAFGWDVVTVDGHSFEQILPAFKEFRSCKFSKPLVVIANTVKGKGVSFMENEPIWHCRIPVGEELARAKRELSMEGVRDGGLG